MEVRFYLSRINGEENEDLSCYVEQILDVLGICGGEHEEVIVGSNWFSLSYVPTLPEIKLELEKEIVQKPVLEFREHNYTDLRRSGIILTKINQNIHLPGQKQAVEH